MHTIMIFSVLLLGSSFCTVLFCVLVLFFSLLFEVSNDGNNNNNINKIQRVYMYNYNYYYSINIIQ